MEKETFSNKLTAQISSGNAAINNLNSINANKKTELSSVNKELNSVNKEINAINIKIDNTNAKIASVQNNMNTEGTYKAETTPNTNNTQGTGEKPMTYNAPTNANISYKNPFVSVSYEQVDYTNFVEALDAISRSNDVSIEQARQQIEKDRQQLRNMFQELR